VRALGGDPGMIAGPRATLTVMMATSSLLLGAGLVCLFWLVARFFTVAQLALGFLEREPKQRMRQTLDDMLAVSALSEQDVLAGVWLHCLRLILPPLLGLALTYAAGTLAQSLLGGAWSLGSAATSYGNAVAVLVSGVLAVTALSFMLVSLGLVPRSGLMPGIGAAAQVLTQVLVVVGGMALLAFHMDLGEDHTSLGYAIGFGVPLILVLGLLLYLARRLDWVRGALGYGFPLVLAAVCLPLYASVVLGGEELQLYEEAYANMLWGLQALAVFSPASLVPGTPLGGLYDAVDFPLNEWWRYLLLVGFQLGLVVMFAEFARDAIRRRKWGTGGA
jgi:hypothetical protein